MIEIRPGLVVGMPFRNREPGKTCGLFQPEVAVSMATMTFPLNTTVAWAPVRNTNQRAFCRNGIAKDTVNMGCPLLLFWDDDVQPPADGAANLCETLRQAEPDVMVVAGVYTGKCYPAEPLVYVGPTGTGAHWRWKRGDIFECSSIATGFMLIRTEVFKHIEMPWFRDVEGETEGWTMKGKAPGATLRMTDDIWFCEKVRAAGFKILCDSRVICGHWDVENDKCYELAPDSYPMRKANDEIPHEATA